MKFKVITFIIGEDKANGYYFYEASHDSDYGKIFGVIGLTLPKAISIMKAKGLDPITNFKMNISVYYHA
jgi:hypothetical protein